MMNFHYTRISKRKPDEALKIVHEQVVKANFAIIQTLDIRAILKAKGLDTPAAYIVEICDPQIAHKLLMEDPLILHFLPCKILIFSEADQTVVSASMPPLMEHFMPRMNFGEISSVIEAAVTGIVNAAL